MKGREGCVVVVGGGEGWMGGSVTRSGVGRCMRGVKGG